MSASKEQHERTYNSILRFYDFAESLIATVEHNNVPDPVAQLEFIEPLVTQIEEATDLLAEEYRLYVKSGLLPGVFSRKRIERSLSKIYATIQICKEQTSKLEAPEQV